MHKKILFKIVVLTVLVVLIGGGYLVWQKFQLPLEKLLSGETQPETSEVMNLEIVPSQRSEVAGGLCAISYQEGAKAIVKGKNLIKVEFYERGGGTGIYNSPEGALVGTGVKNSEGDWEFALPIGSGTWFRSFCAVGFGADGDKSGEACLNCYLNFLGWYGRADVHFSDEVQGTVYLTSADADPEIIKNSYCGGSAGSREYRGDFTLSFRDSNLGLGALVFDENSRHDGALLIKKLNPDNEQDFIIILQYGTCNFEMAKFYGYDLASSKLMRYEFRRKDGFMQDEIYVGPREEDFEVLSSREFVTEVYDNSIGKYRVSRWRFNDGENVFEEVESWLKGT